MLMIHNWLYKIFFFFFSQYRVSESAISMQVIELVGCNAWFFSTIPWLTSSGWHPCTAWFIHSSFKKISVFNEMVEWALHPAAEPPANLLILTQHKVPSFWRCPQVRQASMTVMLRWSRFVLSGLSSTEGF